MANPIALIAVSTAVMTFSALVQLEEASELELPRFDMPEQKTSGFLGGVVHVFDSLGSIVRGVWGAVLFFINLSTFGIIGAPWFIRVAVGSVIIGGYTWSIASLVRGR